MSAVILYDDYRKSRAVRLTVVAGATRLAAVLTGLVVE
jgi:hypothetical protein